MSAAGQNKSKHKEHGNTNANFDAMTDAEKFERVKAGIEIGVISDWGDLLLMTSVRPWTKSQRIMYLSIIISCLLLVMFAVTTFSYVDTGDGFRFALTMGIILQLGLSPFVLLS